MKTMIAEDDAATRFILTSQLSKLGHAVIEAENGAVAWDHYIAEHPETVITDLKMPGINGLELCRRIREHAWERYTYIILLTAMEGRVSYLEGMNAGADDFIVKPCDLVDLKVRLHVAERILSLQSEVQQLEGLLPICPTCKKIRVDRDEWQSVEEYVSTRTNAQFSHGICPRCYETIMKPQLEELKKGKR